MRVACIDIGTNSIRLLLSNYDGKVFSEVSKSLQMTRLGKGVNETKYLADDRIEESVEVIAAYCDAANQYGAEKMYLMATSAVRDSTNSQDFINLVFEKTGQTIEVISGDMEAKVGFMGVLAGSEDPTQMALVIDIGGGSTELIVGDEAGIHYAKSLNIGAVRMTGAYIHSDPVQASESQAVLSFVREQVNTIIHELKARSIDVVIGIGGTATTYATMQHEVTTYSRDKVHRLKVTLDDLMALNSRIESATVEERKHFPGLEEKRADIIYAGGLIMHVIMESLGISSFSVSDYDNLEGFIVYKWQEEHK
jgi:exopolyphosphatase/guanosine-5'-triphosphate,3'-diphosphate pyrophosphatase